MMSVLSANGRFFLEKNRVTKELLFVSQNCYILITYCDRQIAVRCFDTGILVELIPEAFVFKHVNCTCVCMHVCMCACLLA